MVLLLRKVTIRRGRLRKFCDEVKTSQRFCDEVKIESPDIRYRGSAQASQGDPSDGGSERGSGTRSCDSAGTLLRTASCFTVCREKVESAPKIEFHWVSQRSLAI